MEFVSQINQRNIESAKKLKQLGAQLPQSEMRILPIFMSRIKAPVNKGDWDAIDLLIDAGAPLDTYYGENFPLKSAVKLGDIKLAGHLLKRGANPNYTGYKYCPALAVAVNQNDQKMVDLLLASKADPKLKFNAGEGGCLRERTGYYSENLKTISEFMKEKHMNASATSKRKLRKP